MPISPFDLIEGDIGTVVDITLRKAICNFIVNPTGDLILVDNHGLINNDQMYLFTNGSLPGGLSLATIHHVISAKRDQFQLSLTSGGAAVTVTDVGGGTHTFKVILDITAATLVWHWQHGKKTPVTKTGTIQDATGGVTRYTSVADDIEVEDLRIQVEATLASGWHGRSDHVHYKVGRALTKGL